ncbi:MAG: hypothetical protein VX929_00075 [Pseudomonadota bacterium]|nr:hypothetical protein [Pseudomonadota bacterium]
MKTSIRHYRRHRFPPDIIQFTIRPYHRFSFRDIEDFLAVREIHVV